MYIYNLAVVPCIGLVMVKAKYHVMSIESLIETLELNFQRKKIKKQNDRENLQIYFRNLSHFVKDALPFKINPKICI